MEKIEKLIELKTKSIELLKELNNSIQFEQKSGSIQFTCFNYSFFDKTGKELFSGSLEYCKKKAALRKLTWIKI